MKGVVLCVVLLSVYCSDVGKQCNMTGVWSNTLGSVLTLHMDGPHLGGSLHSFVKLSQGGAGDKTGKLIGELIGVVGKGKEPTFSLSISWKGGETVTAWVGQCFVNAPCPYLHSMWLLRSQSTEEEDWKATRIGGDYFYPTNCDVNELP
ncbi:avidin-related protein 4/5-like isoform X2 [Rana temporaria]|uniref:avidin-related protein 4/5-like isoform X2 n=1 Tax=Rana temporaria TaxID=8407 RepID=UPI001AACD258|nr:avidin-related protein 4/5-like isoform X2 [Rana temporaria]